MRRSGGETSTTDGSLPALSIDTSNTLFVFDKFRAGRSGDRWPAGGRPLFRRGRFGWFENEVGFGGCVGFLCFHLGGWIFRGERAFRRWDVLAIGRSGEGGGRLMDTLRV